MKNLRIRIPFLYLYLISLTGFSQNFEGIITYKIAEGERRDKNTEMISFKMKFGSDDGKLTKWVYHHKSTRVFGMLKTKDSSSVLSYYDYAKKDLLLSCTSDLCKLLSLSKIDEEKYKIIKTEEKKKISGYDCQKYIITSIHPTYKVTAIQYLWTTQDITFTGFYPLFDLTPFSNSEFLWAYKSIKGFPVRIDVPICTENMPIVGPCNFIFVAYELESIEQKKLSEKDFESAKISMSKK